MNTPPTVLPPFLCIFCGASSPFSSEEHIVPHSLGNDLLVLSEGWVCDTCNNLFSKFETNALESTILGIERCRLGITSKKGRPAHSKTHKISWFADPKKRPNVLLAEANWDKIPHLESRDGKSGKIIVPVHDKFNADIAYLLLKIGVEVLTPLMSHRDSKTIYDLKKAKKHLIESISQPWPYFILRDFNAIPHLVSVFESTPEDHCYINNIGFDIFLHEIDTQPVLFFYYGAFFAAIALNSPSTDWREALLQWGVSHVGCPAEFAHLSK